LSLTTIVAFGDSITESRRVPYEQRWVTLLEARLRREGRLVRCVNAGVGGNTTRQGLERFERDVAVHHPQFVLIQFGFNDCHIVEGTEPRTSEREFRRNQWRIGTLVREQLRATPLFIANHPTLLFDRKANGRTYEENNIVYNAITREVARELNAPLLDMHARFGRRGTPLGDLLDADGIHLNATGEAEYSAHVGDFLRTLL